MNRTEQQLREQYVDVNFDISWEEISNKILNGNMEYLQGAQDVLHYFMSQALLDKDFINSMYNCLKLTFQQQTINLDNIFKAQCHEDSKHFEDYMKPPEESQESDMVWEGEIIYKDTDSIVDVRTKTSFTETKEQ